MNDLFLFSLDETRLTDIHDLLSARFKMTNLGEVSYYLDMEIDIKVGKQISLWQTAHLKKILERYQMTD